MDFEDDLRAALRPMAPDEGFAERVASRVVADDRSRSRVGKRSVSNRRGWLAAGLVAVLLSGAVGTRAWQVRREAQAREAKRQAVITALRITGATLDLVYQTLGTSNTINLKR